MIRIQRFKMGKERKGQQGGGCWLLWGDISSVVDQSFHHEVLLLFSSCYDDLRLRRDRLAGLLLHETFKRRRDMNNEGMRLCTSFDKVIIPISMARLWYLSVEGASWCILQLLKG